MVSTGVDLLGVAGYGGTVVNVVAPLPNTSMVLHFPYTARIALCMHSETVLILNQTFIYSTHAVLGAESHKSI